MIGSARNKYDYYSCSNDYRDARDVIGHCVNCVISCYNHPARGDYDTEALVFKIATARFLDIFMKKKE